MQIDSMNRTPGFGGGAPSAGIAGNDAKAIAAFGKSAQVDATNAARRAFGPTSARPAKVSENNATPSANPGMGNITANLRGVFDDLVKRAGATAQRYLRFGPERDRAGGGTIAEAAEAAIPPERQEPEFIRPSMARPPVYARGGAGGDAEQPYHDVGDYRAMLGNIDPDDRAAVSEARARAEEDARWMNENDGFVE